MDAEEVGHAVRRRQGARVRADSRIRGPAHRAEGENAQHDRPDGVLRWRDACGRARGDGCGTPTLRTAFLLRRGGQHPAVRRRGRQGRYARLLLVRRHVRRHVGRRHRLDSRHDPGGGGSRGAHARGGRQAVRMVPGGRDGRRRSAHAAGPRELPRTADGRRPGGGAARGGAGVRREARRRAGRGRAGRPDDGSRGDRQHGHASARVPHRPQRRGGRSAQLGRHRRFARHGRRRCASLRGS